MTQPGAPDDPARQMVPTLPRGRMTWLGRKVIRVGPYGLRVLLSPEDEDLAELHWRQHPDRGYAWRRLWRSGQIVWLHHVVAARVLHAAGLTAWPRGHIRFKNGDRLDCRRENLIWRD